ncbi:hypothetical protein [Mucilaginibacter dorajii]|uniref:DUF4252 domain-containing protein n=1 Tax=Mucilaginibacter dorajii TaxID=692994 RepID=A0ABP7QEX6_9SPHI|nr:hypothetical protein [Mucilaginibacter dorajii]MCS3733335.1 hypothetical protein [Mucilaginibacter dorajii]
MKKYLFITLLCLGCADLFGQSITINDLTNLTSLANEDAHNYVVLSKGFKKEYTQVVDGNVVEHLKKAGADKKEESVEIGEFVKLSSGAILRTVTYKTSTAVQVFNLMTQAKSSGIRMRFQGVDVKNNIYLFDNDFFHITMYISRDNTNGFVQVKQKEYLGFD